MKLTLSVSTTSGAKPGSVVDLPDDEARSLIAKGYGTEHRPRTKKTKAKVTADAPTVEKEAHDGRND